MEPKDDPSAGRWQRWFRTKSLDAILEDAEKPEYQLRRALGPVQLTMIGIGAIIGAGIFFTIGTATRGDSQRPGAGPSLILSFVITGVACSFAALCYAEFASMVPISGSAYTYSYATLGELVAWIIGWDLIIEYAVGNVGVAISWGNYFRDFLGSLHFRVLGREFDWRVDIPDWMVMDYRTALQQKPEVLQTAPYHLFGYPVVFNLLAVLIVGIITIVLIWGIRESARFNAWMVGIKILVLTFFIAIGAMFVEPANWTGNFMPNGWAGLSAGAAVVFFAYIGFDAVSTVAEEAREPQRNLPIGILASLVVCTIFYVIVAAVFTGMFPYEELLGLRKDQMAEPLTQALDYAGRKSGWGLGWAVGIVAFGSVIAHTAVLLVYQLGQTRIFFSISRDGLMPPLFRRIHPRFRTPYVSTILIGVVVAAVSAVANIEEMVDLTNIGTLFAFILVCLGIIVLRIKDPQRPRPFRVPGGWTLPILGIISCLYLIYYLPATSWLRFAAWLNVGFVVYVGYGSVHSRLTGRAQSPRPADHDAHTASLGAWLAIAGAALVVVMRGVEAWLEALEHHEALPLLARARAAAGDVLHPAPWLEWSWFLIIPLVLNAFVLCPIVIRRALKARREGVDYRAGKIGRSLGLAVGLAVVTAIYLTLIAIHQPAPSAPKEEKPGAVAHATTPGSMARLDRRTRRGGD